MKVLVIFDMIPEEQLRAIVDMTNEEYEFFSKAHDHIINIDDDEEAESAANVINGAFVDGDSGIEYCDTDMERQYYGKWKSDTSNTDISGVERLIYSGFYL